jgi:hypothetical protein
MSAEEAVDVVKNPESTPEQLEQALDRLHEFSATVEFLELTGAGLVVNGLKKHVDQNIATKAKTLVKKWKDQVKNDSSGSRKRSREETSTQSVRSKPATHSAIEPSFQAESLESAGIQAASKVKAPARLPGKTVFFLVLICRTVQDWRFNSRSCSKKVCRRFGRCL